jgi:putative addiction module killer protein
LDVEPKVIKIYVARDGRTPYEDWFGELADTLIRAIVDARLARVRRGLLGDTKPTGSGVFELRIDHGPGFRIYFGQDRKNVILLCGGTKATQKRDIGLARAFWIDFLNRRGP